MATVNGKTSPASGTTPITTEEIDRVDGPQVNVKTLYTTPESVFSELPVPTMDKLTDLARNRFANEIVAAGQVTDKQLSVFRTQFVCDMIVQQHKQLVSRVTVKKLLKSREFYKSLRERGMERTDAIKLSGYNPDLE